MRSHRNRASIRLAAPLPQITNQFFARVELRASRLIAVEIPDQTNSERDVVQEVAMHMSAIDLPSPTIADLNLAVASRSAVADDKVIRETIFHPAHASMVIIEHARVALSRAAIVDDDEFPAVAGNWCPSNLFDNRASEIVVSSF